MDGNNHFDTVGVGFGPANIALAVAYAEAATETSIRFLEANAGPSWQPGMVIEGSDIQHNPLRDFITPRNPCSPYGYLSYLKSEGRLFQFLNLDAPFPPRSDYARYVAWVAEQFRDQVLYSRRVRSITLVEETLGTDEPLVEVATDTERFTARSVCFAPGRSSNVPVVFAPFLGERVLHFTNYTSTAEAWKRCPPSSVAVVGSSQSAVEILLDLRSKLPGTTLHSVFRKFSYMLKDTSPFTEEVVFPEFTDYFYGAPESSKRELMEQLLRNNYGSVDHDILRKLYFTLYEDAVNERESIAVHNNTCVTRVRETDGGLHLTLRDEHRGTSGSLEVEAVVLATGFRNSGGNEKEELIHPLLRDIAGYYRRNPDGTLHVARDYQLTPRDGGQVCPPFVISGLCESSHGLGDAGSFSLLSYRAAEIEETLTRSLSRTGVPVAG